MGQIVNIPIIGEPEPLYVIGEEPCIDDAKIVRVGRAMEYHDKLLEYAVSFEPVLRDLIALAVVRKGKQLFQRRKKVSLDDIYDEGERKIRFEFGDIDYAVPIKAGKVPYDERIEHISNTIEELDGWGFDTLESGAGIYVHIEKIGQLLVLLSTGGLLKRISGIGLEERIVLQKKLGLSVVNVNDMLFAKALQADYVAVDDLARLKDNFPINSQIYHNLLVQAAMVKGAIIKPAEDYNKALYTSPSVSPKETTVDLGKTDSKKEPRKRQGMIPATRYDLSSHLQERASSSPKSTYNALVKVMEELDKRVKATQHSTEPIIHTLKIAGTRITMTYMNTYVRGRNVQFVAARDLRFLLQSVQKAGIAAAGSTTAQTVEVTSKPPKLGNISDILKHV